MNKPTKQVKNIVQELANFRDGESVLMISVKEGDGTEKRPMEIAQYIIHKDGSVLGKLDRNWMTRDILTNKTNA